MADKSITDLNVVPGSIDDSNTWFAVAQSGAAYKVSGHEFILALTVILDGHGGIKSITGPTTVGLVDTYTITYADDTYDTFEVTNGKGITGISKTGTSGLVDTYTITYNDGDTDTFTVTNGEKGDTGDAWYVWIRYSGSQPTQDSDMGTNPDNWMGIYSGTSSTAPTHYTDYDWFQIKGAKGDPGTPSTITSQSVTYQEGTSGTVAPSGTWTTTVPSVAQGNYLWTKNDITFNSGSPLTFYSVARMGVDGSGSVSSVNSVSPDGSGNVALDADDIPTDDNTSVQYKLHSKADQVIISGVESSSVASKAYSVGDYLILVGVLYKVTTDIASGGTIVTSGSGQNVNSVIVTDEIVSLGAELTLAENSITSYVVGNTNTTGETLNVGTFVWVKNHSVLSDGLYTVKTTAIVSGGSVVDTNMNAVSAGGLNDLKNSIGKNNFGNIVDITSYTSDKYTAPCDGYVAVYANGSSNVIQAFVYGANNGGNILRIRAARENRQCVLVKKGVKIKHDTSNDAGTGNEVLFIPIE